MESIIIIALIFVATSVIKAVSMNGIPQKKSSADTLCVEPRVQSTVKATNKSNNFDISEIIKMSVAPVHKQKMKTSNICMEPKLYKEETQIEVSECMVTPEQSEVTADIESFILPEDITFDELRRSIIMAEVLGKPRALKKTIR